MPGKKPAPPATDTAPVEVPAAVDRRESIFDQIDLSRDRQTEQFGGEPHDKEVPRLRWQLLLSLRQGDVAGAVDDIDDTLPPERIRRALYRYRTSLVELASTTVAALEAHDVVVEELFNPKPEAPVLPPPTLLTPKPADAPAPSEKDE